MVVMIGFSTCYIPATGLRQASIIVGFQTVTSAGKIRAYRALHIDIEKRNELD